MYNTSESSDVRQWCGATAVRPVPIFFPYNFDFKVKCYNASALEMQALLWQLVRRQRKALHMYIAMSFTYIYVVSTRCTIIIITSTTTATTTIPLPTSPTYT